MAIAKDHRTPDASQAQNSSICTTNAIHYRLNSKARKVDASKLMNDTSLEYSSIFHLGTPPNSLAIDHNVYVALLARTVINQPRLRIGG